MLFSLFITIISNVLIVNCWNLESYDIGPNYYVSSITIFGNRAFLALPRSSCLNKIENPTLIEIPWFNEPNFHSQIWKKPFAQSEQTWDTCDHIQDAIHVVVDKSKLWVLDKGNENCPAKMLIFNLFHNSVSLSCELKRIPSREKLSTFVVDSIGPYNPRAYIGFKDLGKLVILTLNELKYWIVDLNIDSTQFLALAPKETKLFISGMRAEDFYEIDVEDIRESEGPLAVIANEVTEKMNATSLGEKLGPSSGLVADLKYGLIYYLIRDFAIVRWDYRKPPKAEYYNVLAQSYEMMPFVSQLFAGPKNGIWALINPEDSYKCSIDNEIPENTSVLKTRIIKILKYNKFTNRNFPF